MKYCIVPDVHGRSFWKGLNSSLYKYDKVVFLGDYLDPYVRYDGVTQEEAFDNFKELLGFARNHKDKVLLLLGNHDFHYFPNISVDYGCRRDDERYKEIQNLFVDNLGLFRMCDVIDTKTYGLVALSHAGITQGWCGTVFGDSVPDNWVDFFNHITGNAWDTNRYLWVVSDLRGGESAYGSMIWADIEEHDSKSTREANRLLGVDYQIFGHTYSFPTTEDIYECEGVYAMIDNKQLFEIE